MKQYEAALERSKSNVTDAMAKVREEDDRTRAAETRTQKLEAIHDQKMRTKLKAAKAIEDLEGQTG